MFQAGTLWDAVCKVTDRGLQTGVLQPIPTECQFVRDQGVRFLVRVVHNVARKRRAAVSGAERNGERPNPFLPYDANLYVADASETHVCLLNKFNVVDHHLLIVTREFEHQQVVLSARDFQALGRCLAEYDGLGFYNSGTIAGASQPHKHLQYVPLPLAAEGPRLPIEPLLEIALPGRGPARVPSLAFRHAAARLPAGSEGSSRFAPEQLLATYRDLLPALDNGQPSGEGQHVATPYNLLVTRQWMMLVPRSRETFQSISLNALAFAGALLVRDRGQLELLVQAGPMQVLGDVTR